MRVRESTIEQELIEKLDELKYTLRPDIRDRAALEINFRAHFQALNRVTLTDAEFVVLLEDIVTPDVFAAAHTLRHRNAFTRDDGTSLNATPVNIAKGREMCSSGHGELSCLYKYAADGIQWTS